MVEEREAFQGLVEVYTGLGKGKTSAALGVVMRAVGHGLKAHIVFFMKGDYPYGEQATLEKLPNVSFSRFGHRHFIDPTQVTEEERAQAQAALQEGRRALLSGDYDIVVLDEVNVAAAWGLVAVEEVLGLISQKPPSVELILTGRYAPPQLAAAADLVTEMVEVKHPFKRGVLARRGIDY